ncbi:MAG: hypothetical protein SFX73_31835 [Kofleriaceae bacterium]|nr:hypothetical protein [Kofleriaceae bacterium]
MTTEAQRKRELSHVMQMIELLPLDVIGEPQFFERPDFLLATREDGLVAVEHTESRDEYMARGQGAYVLLKRLISEGLARDGVTAGVALSASGEALAVLQPQPAVLRREVDVLVSRAVIAARAGERVTMNEKELRAAGVMHVRSAAFHADAKTYVGISSTEWGRPASRLQQAIDDKGKLLPAYREALVAAGHDGVPVWLLVVGSSGRGGSIDLEDAEDSTYCSDFDRTLLLDQFADACVDLAVERAT